MILQKTVEHRGNLKCTKESTNTLELQINLSTKSKTKVAFDKKFCTEQLFHILITLQS